MSTETPAIAASEKSVALVTAIPTNVAPPATQEKSPYAYVFYATEDSYACSVLVNIQRLQDLLHTEHRIFVLASHDVSPEYITLFEQRNVTVSMQTPPELADGSAWYYKDCLLKLFAFKMHLIDPSLKKVIALDSDQLVLQNLDHLFKNTIDVDLAAPRAYWIAKDAISSTFMLIQLSDRLWHMVEEAIRTVTLNNYDMDLVNQLLGDTVMMLPGQFITPNSHWEDWNLPKWFHATNITPSIEQSTEATNSSSSSNDTSTSNQAKRQALDLDAISNARAQAKNADASAAIKSASEASSAYDGQSHGTADHQKTHSAQEEQINASSGDIFDYLEPSKVQTSHDEEASPALIPEASPEVSKEYEIPLKEQSLSLEEKEKLPLFNELYELEPAVSVLHFFGLGKPWTYRLEDVENLRPGAHPLFLKQFRLWRETARNVCPSGPWDTL